MLTVSNLTRTPMLHDQAAFDTVVLQGALIERGMGSFADGLKPEDTMAIRSYLIARANELKQAEPPAAFCRDETGMLVIWCVNSECY